MSLRVLVIPEDPVYNGYLLQPLVERLLAECGRPKARVSILSNPRTEGYEHAKRLIRDELLASYRHVDLLLFLPDRDGKEREAELDALENYAAEVGVKLLCCAAVEEVEAWALAGHLDKLNEPWREIRAMIDVKERVFLPFLARYGNARVPGGDRKRIMQEAMQSYRGVRQRCSEPKKLEQRVRQHLG